MLHLYLYIVNLRIFNSNERRIDLDEKKDIYTYFNDNLHVLADSM